MPDEDASKKLRKKFVTANKYQKDIIFLAFLPTVSIFLAFNLIVALANPAITVPLFHTSILGLQKSTGTLSIIIVVIMCTFFILSLTGAFIISHKMVGGFDRIIRELDEIIAGRSKRTIYSRPKDTLSKELLKRINILIEFYVANKKQDS